MKFQSMTQQFPPDELRWLSEYPAEDLASSLKESSPVIALRAMAEIMLNGDEEKLTALLADDELTAFWKGYKGDWGLDERDDQYFAQLEAKLKK